MLNDITFRFVFSDILESENQQKWMIALNIGFLRV